MFTFWVDEHKQRHLTVKYKYKELWKLPQANRKCVFHSGWASSRFCSLLTNLTFLFISLPALHLNLFFFFLSFRATGQQVSVPVTMETQVNRSQFSDSLGVHGYFFCVCIFLCKKESALSIQLKTGTKQTGTLCICERTCFLPAKCT